MKRLVRVGLALVVLVASTAVAHADDADVVERADGPPVVVRDDSTLVRDHARELFLEGVRLSDQVRWAEALDWFRESYARRAAPAPLLNIGIALRAVGRQREAAETFTEFLRLFQGRSEEHDRLARQYRDEALAAVARIRVRGLPPAASLSIDGRVARGSRSGDEVVVIADPGEHVLVARDERGRTVREVVRLLPGDDHRLDIAFARRARGGASRGGSPVAGIVLTTSGGLALLAGVGAAYLLVQQISEIEDCRSAGDVPGEFCVNEGTLDERRDVLTGLTIGFGLAGAGLTTVGVVLLVGSAGGDDDDPERASIGCAPSSRGITCSGRF